MAKTINNIQKPLAPSTAQKNSDITKAEIEAKLTGSITSHKHDFTTMINCSNKDFNTIKTAGFYYGYTGMINAAEQAISVLEVIVYSPDWIVQRQTVINATGKTYERHYHNGNTWSTWKMIYDSKNKPTPADIGAATSASVGTLSSLQTTNKDNLVAAINEVFQSGNSAKQELVAALVAKGLSATTDMTFSQLIDSVETGLVKPAGTAVAANVLSGKTFINSTGQLVTGTVPYLQSNIPNVNQYTATHYMTSDIIVADLSGLGGNCVYFAMPTGVYNHNQIGWLMSYCPNLRSENIVNGVNILGVVGTATAASLGGTTLVAGGYAIVGSGSQGGLVCSMNSPVTITNVSNWRSPFNGSVRFTFHMNSEGVRQDIGTCAVSRYNGGGFIETKYATLYDAVSFYLDFNINKNDYLVLVYTPSVDLGYTQNCNWTFSCNIQ